MMDGPRGRVSNARNPRARQAGIVAVLLASLLVVSCAAGRSAQQSVGGWVDRVRGSVTAKGEPRVAYVAASRTKVYDKPDAQSPVTGVLGRDEEVARYQSEGGFAYLEAKGNIWGWVPESRLVEQSPQARARAAVRPAEVSAPPQDSTTSADSPAAATAPGQPSESPPPDSEEEPIEPERSVFDPY